MLQVISDENICSYKNVESKVAKNIVLLYRVDQFFNEVSLKIIDF